VARDPTRGQPEATGATGTRRVRPRARDLGLLPRGIVEICERRIDGRAPLRALHATETGAFMARCGAPEGRSPGAAPRAPPDSGSADVPTLD